MCIGVCLCLQRVSFTKDKEIEPHRSVCAFCRSQGEIKATVRAAVISVPAMKGTVRKFKFNWV